MFLASIGAAILLNLGSNWFMGEISYITKALSAVLQLAVTMDYSIFLWHSYNEQRAIYPDKCEAMAHAISATLTSVVGSSITTIAGFLALCFMSFTLGRDLGIVMAKGVLLGVLSLRDGPAVAHPAARQAPAEDAPSLYPSEDGWLGQGRDEGVPGVPGAVRGAGSGVLLRL